MDKIVMGIMGVKKSGKTTTYEFLKEYIPHLEEFSLAAKLKNCCSDIFKEVPTSYYHDQTRKEVELDVPVVLTTAKLNEILNYFSLSNINETLYIRPHINKILYTPRQILQYIGSEFLRNIDADIHCLATAQMIKESESNIVVIPDIRFPNEFKFFKDRYLDNFKPYGVVNHRATLLAESDKHISEQFALALPSTCTLLENNGAMSAFKETIKSNFVDIINKFGGRL
jgi:hypothetical protein